MTLTTIAALAGSAAIYTAATYGHERSGVLGGLVGLACALGCLIGPKLLADAARRCEWAAATAAFLMLALSAAFALSGALGAAASQRDIAARTDAKRHSDAARLNAEHKRA